MFDQPRDLVKQTISNTPGTSGDLTLSAAVSSWLALGASDDGLTFTATIYASDSDTAAKEVRTGCVYTHGTLNLTRGTLEAGTAINLTSSAVVCVVIPASAAHRWDAAALSDVAGTDADTTMVLNSLYVVDMSAWATANRTYTLPATAAVGDRIGIAIIAGDASHELLITAGTGDTLNGIAGGTEWSRLFITGEVVIMRCVTANSAWVVEQDGRIAQQALMGLTTAATAEAANTFVRPTSQSGAWTAHTDNASLCTTSTGQIKTRRAGKFSISAFGFSTSALGASKYFSVAVYLSGTTNILFASSLSTPTGLVIGQQAGAAADAYSMAADDYLVYLYRSEEGSKGLFASSLPRVTSWFSLREAL